MKRAPAGALMAGVFATQLVNSALHLVQPLLLAKLSGSLSLAALFSSFDTAVHMFGTFVGGWPTDRFGARRVLVISTFLRGVILSAIPLAQLGGFLTVPWAMAWYTADAFIRGFVDASVHTVPLELADHESAQLDKLNASYELLFDVGGILGPLILGGLMISGAAIAPSAIIPAGFAVSAAIYAFLPKRERKETNTRSRGSLKGIQIILHERKLLLATLGLALFNLYPLRKLMAALFASSIAGDPAVAGFVGAAFAGGGVVGVMLYAWLKAKSKPGQWIFAGACGLLMLAIGWIPAHVPTMACAAFFFALTNVGARLGLTRIRQEFTPLEFSGGVTAASQFSSNLASVVTKAMVGVAFAAAVNPYAAFAIIGITLAVLALAQVTLAQRLARA